MSTFNVYRAGVIQQRREARIFIYGFYAGLTLGLVVAAACVAVALLVR